MPRLTDARVRDLRARKTTRNVRDTTLAGFGVRVLRGGGKRFFLHSQHEGQRVWKILGDPANMPVADARARARDLLVSLRSGQGDGEMLFETVAEEAFRRHGRRWKPGTLMVNRNYLKNTFFPVSWDSALRTSRGRTCGTGLPRCTQRRYRRIGRCLSCRSS